MGFFDIQVKYRVSQHLAHDFQGNRGIVDQKNLHRRRYASIGCEDRFDFFAAERLHQKLVGIELTREIDAALVGTSRNQCDESLVSRNSRAHKASIPPMVGMWTSINARSTPWSSAWRHSTPSNAWIVLAEYSEGRASRMSPWTALASSAMSTFGCRCCINLPRSAPDAETRSKTICSTSKQTHSDP